ncbi:MAG: type II toxin-antitoxin system VapC family toxin [Opitutaceae bacterium]
MDTCTLLWLVLDQSQLSTVAGACLKENAGGLYVSPLTAFEIGQKTAAGKLTLELPPARWFARALELHGLRECAFTSAIALRASALPRLHADPFDRILIATAQHDAFTLLTPDPKIRAYPDLLTLW